MPFEVDWRPGAIADVQDLFDYLAEHASLWDARHVDLPLDDHARGGGDELVLLRLNFSPIRSDLSSLMERNHAELANADCQSAVF